MAKIHLTNVVVLDNPAPFLNPFQFEVTFECIEELKEDLEWKVVYVGSAESEDYDQVLDTILVGPVPEGRHMFVFQAASPDTSRIPAADAVGVTVVLLMCSYKGQEFVRVGYFINNEYTDPEMRENPPAEPQYQQMMRNILATAPRVTRFKIDWDGTGIQGSAGEGTSGCSGEVDQCLSNDVSSAFSGAIPAVMPLGDGSLMDNDNSQSTHNAMEVM
ncbi:hypothetical protein B566_EDAN005311 [Ephemera danica]|nr:hypothetical protein B566_EDAN005311 [Ephemera danica]